MKGDNRWILIGIMLMLTVIICVAILLVVYADNQTVQRSSVDVVELIGVLKGFEKNNTYWDVKLGNQTYIFNVFDACLMENLTGHDIIIFCTGFEIVHYNLVHAWQIKEKEVK